MKIAKNRSPVAVAHPVTGQYVTITRGDEIDDPAFLEAEQHAWLFEETPEPGEVTSVPIEQATRQPGETRRNRQR